MTRPFRLPAALLLVATFMLTAAAHANTGSRSPAGPGSSPPPASVSPFLVNATITEAFDTVAGTSTNGCVTGWTCSNLSSPAGATSWFQGSNVAASGPFDAQAGAANAYIAANFNNTGSTGTISNWLLTPQVSFGTGATLSFWTRTVSPSAFADRLEVRISTNGASTNVGATSTSVGDFTTVVVHRQPEPPCG